jgi:adenylate kinase
MLISSDTDIKVLLTIKTVQSQEYAIGQLLELASIHVSMLLSEHAFKQIALFTHPHRHTSEHLLPAMPDTVVRMLHPAHVSRPLFVEAEPSAVETDRSGTDDEAAMESRAIQGRAVASNKSTSVAAVAAKATVTPHGNRVKRLYSNEKDELPGIGYA